MCGYICPFGKRIKQHNFLLCGKMMDEQTNYGQKENALQAYCIHQHHCTVTRKQENTPEARTCKMIQPDKQSV